MIRVAVVGCGKIAETSHLPALKKLERRGILELVAVVDVDERAAKRAAKRFQVPSYYTNPEEVAKKYDIDAVHICTPSTTHAELSLLFARAGKHVLVEKPMCHTYDEALAIKDTVKESGVVFSVVQNFRFIDCVKRAKRTIVDGRLGRLLSIEGALHRFFPIRWSRSLWVYQQGGVIHDIGPHLIDTVLWLKGVKRPDDIRGVRATGGDMLGHAGFVNHVNAFVEFTDNSVAFLSLSWISGAEEFTLKICGTGGTLLIDLTYNNCVEERGSPLVFDLYRRYYEGIKASLREFLRFHSLSALLTWPGIAQALTVYLELITRFVRAINGEGRPPVTLQEALATMLVIDRMLKQTITFRGHRESRL